jgi:serine/threonine-protein kinase
VGVDGTARITDFGIARAATHLRGDLGVIEGKLAYVAPEQLSSGAITQRTDLFSMGVVLWELLTGEMLFRQDTDGATICAALRRPIPPPSALDPTLPHALDAVVLRALQREPARRFASALEFLTALERLPITPATARAVGEYVRRDRRTLVPDWESAAFRRRAVPDSIAHADVPVRTSGVIEVPRSVSVATQELPTRVSAPPPALLAAASKPPAALPPGRPDASDSDISSSDNLRMRRLIVAVALVLLGCAGALLISSSMSPPQSGAGSDNVRTQPSR